MKSAYTSAKRHFLYEEFIFCRFLSACRLKKVSTRRIYLPKNSVFHRFLSACRSKKVSTCRICLPKNSVFHRVLSACRLKKSVYMQILSSKDFCLPQGLSACRLLYFNEKVWFYNKFTIISTFNGQIIFKFSRLPRNANIFLQFVGNGLQSS